MLPMDHALFPIDLNISFKTLALIGLHTVQVITSSPLSAMRPKSLPAQLNQLGRHISFISSVAVIIPPWMVDSPHVTLRTLCVYLCVCECVYTLVCMCGTFCVSADESLRALTHFCHIQMCLRTQDVQLLS